MESPSSSDAVSEKPDKNRIFAFGFSCRQLLVLFLLCLSQIISGSMLALIAPFLPHLAEIKGLSSTQYGLVSAALPLCQVALSPTLVTGFMIPRLGLKHGLAIGMLTVGCSNFAFTFLPESPPRWTFFAIAISLRLVCAVGESTASVAAYAYVMIEFSDRIADVYPLLQLCFSVGLMLGPAAGGILHQIGGFGLPFFAFASIAIVDAAFLMICMTKAGKSDGEAEAGVISSLVILKNYRILSNILIVFVTYIFMGFVDVSLSTHLEQSHFGMTSAQIGYMFLLTESMYCISSQVTGQLVKRFDQTPWWPPCGFACLAAASIISGPMWPLTFASTINIEIIRLVFVGFGTGLLMVGSFMDGSNEVVSRENVLSIESPAVAFSALYGSSCNLGMFIGQAAGGALYEWIGYEKVFSLLFVVQVTMILTALVSFCRQEVGHEKESSDRLGRYQLVTGQDSAP